MTWGKSKRVVTAHLEDNIHDEDDDVTTSSFKTWFLVILPCCEGNVCSFLCLVRSSQPTG